MKIIWRLVSQKVLNKCNNDNDYDDDGNDGVDDDDDEGSLL